MSEKTLKEIFGAERDKSKFLPRNNERSNDLASYVFQKLPPQAVPVEEAVLGALLTDKDALTSVMDILRPESFYLDAHQLIYKAILKLFEKSQPIDLLTVKEALLKAGDLEKVGNAVYLADLTNRVGSAANIEYHARIIAQKHIQRELIRISTKTIKDAFEDSTDVFQLLDNAEQGLFDITQNNLNRSYEQMGSIASQLLKQIEEISKREDGLTGIPTGFTGLDRLTSGWQRSDLIIIAARPSMGKTALTLNLARNAAIDFKKPIAIFSLEMSNLQLVQRLISMESEIAADKLRNAKLEDYEWQQLQSTIERMSDVPIFVDDTPALNIFELRAKCRRLKQQHGIELVIIDYLQLMSGGSETKGNREQEIGSISRSLKGMAKELNIPVIALSQLSRAVEVRGGAKRPQLSDLRESGCLAGETLVLDSRTGQLIPIKELAEKQTAIHVLATDEAFKLGSYPLSKAFYSGQKMVYELKTKSGKRIKASANHPFLKLSGWTRLDELKVGDRLGSIEKFNSKNNNNIYWDEIQSITQLGIEDVYDLTIDKVHNFVANDFIVHNSIEQDADIVAFIYRPEYYQIMEDEQGQSLKGVTEFIVSKHRNGALDTIKLRFRNEIGRFTDFEDADLDNYLSGGSNFAGDFSKTTNPNDVSIMTRPSKMNDEDIPF
jgi:replicative DNA helicase